MKPWIIAVISATLLWNAGPAAAAAPSSVPGEFVIQVRPDLSFSDLRLASVRQSFASSLKRVIPALTRIHSMEPFATDPTLVLVKANPDAALQASASFLNLNGEEVIQLIEPNWIIRLLEFPTDPDFRQSWNLRNERKPGADIGVIEAWERGIRGSHDIRVAVLDTGIQWDHPDLKENLDINPGEAGELSANGIDDDGNGFIDDVHGWNFVTRTPDSRDDRDHGTHVAGIIGARANNAAGTCGVNWEVSLLPVKFLDRFGSGTLQSAIEAINYARLRKARIINASWGGYPASPLLEEAVRKTQEAGILFVVAAGNESANNDSRITYPASYRFSNLLTVAATDELDGLASFSNFGRKTVHVAAPGADILSTVIDSEWDIKSGTSMAAPHVSGIAALLLSHEPGLTPEQMITRLVRTSDPLYKLKRVVRAGGRVNASNALFNRVPEPLEPGDPALWRDHPFALESEHPYADRLDWRVPIHVPGARYLRIHFSKIETESFDRIFIETPEGEIVETLWGIRNDYLSETVRGDTIVLRFRTDLSFARYGFQVDRLQVVLTEDR